MRVAIVHYWLVNMRGGEKVVEALCDMFPDADIFTHVYDPDKISETINRHRVRTTFINGLPQATRRYQAYLPLMPLALEQLDLRGYDLVISSESGPAKGVVAPPGATHVCYCHSPMRYIWDMYHDYRGATGHIRRLLMPPLAHYLRLWDAAVAARVDRFICNSDFVRRRVRRFYGRDADVIAPPVDIDAFTPTADHEDFYLVVGQLTAYKRPDLAVEAFNRLGKRLVVIGDGEQLPLLRRLAHDNVSILGWQPAEVIRDHYMRCRALVFPGIEDFGIVPVEAMASGKPVIAFRAGGALETVVDGVTGTFFNEPTPEALMKAIAAFERAPLRFVAEDIARHAGRFGRTAFKHRMERAIEEALQSGGRAVDRLAGSALAPSHTE